MFPTNSAPIWRKHQQSNKSTMSSFWSQSSPSFPPSTSGATTIFMSQRSTDTMSMIPWKSVNPPSTLYHTTISSEFWSHQEVLYDCRSNFDLGPGGTAKEDGGPVILTSLSTIHSTSWSYSSGLGSNSPIYQDPPKTWKPVASTFFTWAMGGFLFATTLHPHHLTAVYNRYFPSSPQGLEVNAKGMCSQKSHGCQEKAKVPVTTAIPVTKSPSSFGGPFHHFPLCCSSSVKSTLHHPISRRLLTDSDSSSSDSFAEFSDSSESSDSFCIVFESAADAGAGDKDSSSGDADESDSDDDDDDDTDDEGLIFQLDSDDNEVESDQSDPGEGQIKKTVSFDEKLDILEFEDDMESKLYRKPFWEIVARDRSRFTDRIRKAEVTLSAVFVPTHRFTIFQQRFMKAESAEPSTNHSFL